MTDAIDQIPAPEQIRPLRVIGLGASRTGTVGLFQALKVLNYRPFHITELLPHGTRQMHALGDAMIASETSQPWKREKYDKLFGNYDCLVECPCYFGKAGIEMYVSDPNIRFILTTRSPQSFSKSLEATLVRYYVKLGQWPLSLARYLDTFTWELERMFGIMVRRWSDGVQPGQAGFRAVLEKNLLAYEDTVKALVPPERLLVLDLEKGFGFDEICSFLDCPVPEEPYPRSNALSEFNAAAEMILAPSIQKTKVVVSATVIGISALVFGLLFRRVR